MKALFFSFSAIFCVFAAYKRLGKEVKNMPLRPLSHAMFCAARGGKKHLIGGA